MQERCLENDGCWPPGAVLLSDEDLARVVADPLDDRDREILLASGVPDLVAMASPAPDVAGPAMRRRLRDYLPKPCPTCSGHPAGHAPSCRKP